MRAAAGLCTGEKEIVMPLEPQQEQKPQEFMEDVFDQAAPAPADDKGRMDAVEPPPPADPPSETPPAEQPPAEQVAEQVEPGAPPATEAPSADPVAEGLEHAAVAERKKRQDIEARTAELERRNAYLEGLAKGQQLPTTQPPLQQATPEQQEAEKERLDRLYFENPREYAEERAREIARAQIVESRVRDSAMRLSAEVADYAEVMQRFTAHANQPQNKYLWGQLENLPDPARQAYNYMKQLENPPQPFNADAEREKIRQEERAKLEKELAGNAADQIPRTPVSAHGAGPGAAPVAKPGPSIDDLLEENEV